MLQNDKKIYKQAYKCDILFFDVTRITGLQPVEIGTPVTVQADTGNQAVGVQSLIEIDGETVEDACGSKYSNPLKNS